MEEKILRIVEHSHLLHPHLDIGAQLSRLREYALYEESARVAEESLSLVEHPLDHCRLQLALAEYALNSERPHRAEQYLEAVQRASDQWTPPLTPDHLDINDTLTRLCQELFVHIARQRLLDPRTVPTSSPKEDRAFQEVDRLYQRRETWLGHFSWPHERVFSELVRTYLDWSRLYGEAFQVGPLLSVPMPQVIQADAEADRELHFQKARHFLEQALHAFEKMPAEGHARQRLLLAELHSNTALLHLKRAVSLSEGKNKQWWAKAIQYANKSLEILASIAPLEVLPDLDRIDALYATWADLYHQLDGPENMTNPKPGLLLFYRRLVKDLEIANDPNHREQLIKSYNDLAGFSGDTLEQIECRQNALQLLVQEIDQGNDLTTFLELLTTLRGLGDAYLAEENWSKAHYFYELGKKVNLQLLRRHPEVLPYWNALAANFSLLIMLYQDQFENERDFGHLRQFYAVFSEVQAIFEKNDHELTCPFLTVERQISAPERIAYRQQFGRLAATPNYKLPIIRGESATLESEVMAIYLHLFETYRQMVYQVDQRLIQLACQPMAPDTLPSMEVLQAHLLWIADQEKTKPDVHTPHNRLAIALAIHARALLMNGANEAAEACMQRARLKLRPEEPNGTGAFFSCQSYLYDILAKIKQGAFPPPGLDLESLEYRTAFFKQLKQDLIDWAPRHPEYPVAPWQSWIQKEQQKWTF